MSHEHDFCMTSAREYPHNSQNPSLQNMIGLFSTCALAMMKLRSVREKTENTKNHELFYVFINRGMVSRDNHYLGIINVKIKNKKK